MFTSSLENVPERWAEFSQGRGGGAHGDFADRLVQNMSSDSTLMDNRNLVCLAMPSLAGKSWLRGFMPGGDACKHARFF